MENEQIVVFLSEFKKDITHIKERLDEKIKVYDEHVFVTFPALESRLQLLEFSRVKTLEDAISALKKAEWQRLLFSSVIGGVVGSRMPDAISIIIKFFFG